MQEAMDYHTAKALLEWQVELGVTETIGEMPVDRFELEPQTGPEPAAAPMPAPAAATGVPGAQGGQGQFTAPPSGPPAVDPVAEARAAAMTAVTLDALAEAQRAFEHCELKKGARNFVFADGVTGARVMVLGEAPDREEDRAGRPFQGAAGQMLDAMFAAIGLARASNGPEQGLYLSTVLPWRPPQGRAPRADELAMMMPFVEKHVALAAPEMVVLMGNLACQAVLGRQGISRLRGQWTEALGRPVLPMLPPERLLADPLSKRAAWADLLSLQARLGEGA
jgi:DNA polymerase